MYYPTLKRFMDNPSYIDTGRFGYFWKNHYDYEARWREFRKSFFNIPVNYYIENSRSYYIHLLVPSRVKGNTYDVVFHFFLTEDEDDSVPNLNNYFIRIFSNNPVFAYQFGYANYKYNIAIDFLADKLPREVIEVPAKAHNPKDNVGFDHSTYFAGMYLLSASRFLNKDYIDGKAMPFNINTFKVGIRHLDQTMDEYAQNKDKVNRYNSFNQRKTSGEKVKDTIEDVKSKAKDVSHKVLHPIDTLAKPKKVATNYIGDGKSAVHRVQKITAQRTNVKGKSSSAVRRISASKSSRKK